MDTAVAHLPLNSGFLLNSLGIILVNIVLSGDNSVVIAMAVHGLPRPLRLRGLVIGTIGAVVLRVFVTLIAANLLKVPFLKLAGGVAILWIAIKLLIEDEEAHEGRPPPASVWHAVRIILIADLTLSIDNVLAVAGVSGGDAIQLWFSLGLSIPMVVFAGAVLSNLMDRYPVILVLGAALLGKVGGEMLVTDPGLVDWFHLPRSDILSRGAQIAGACGVLLVAWRLHLRLRPARPGAVPDRDLPDP